MRLQATLENKAERVLQADIVKVVVMSPLPSSLLL